jgi:two-component system, LuxR family, sensor histidine kinase DctS
MMTERAAKPRQKTGFLAGSANFAVRGWLVISVLMLFLAVFAALTYLVWRYERSETQLEYDLDTRRVASTLRGQLLADLRNFQVTGAIEKPEQMLSQLVQNLAANRPSVLLVELHRQALREPLRLFHRGTPQANAMRSASISAESLAAAAQALRRDEIAFSTSAFMPVPDRLGQEVIDAWIPLQPESNSSTPAALRVVFHLTDLLADWLPREFAVRNEVSLREADGTVLAWGPGLNRGAGTFRATAILDLPGNPLVLHTNSENSGPRLIPNAMYGLVILLGLTLLGSFFLLFRDIRSRLLAERRLRDALSFRTAMENSLITGLRARDLDGRITYVNQAFCDMVGFSAAEIIGRAPPMPYWAPEGRQEYERRHAQVIAGTITTEGFETVFMHKNGSRFPALVYEAPLIDQAGKHSGWMGSIVDITKQRQIEQRSLAQQEQLERASRLSTMGELASVLSHELNQPLSAISSYATGAGNLLLKQEPDSGAQLASALQTIQRQAQRAGAIINRMQDFVRKRDIQSEVIDFRAIAKSLESLILLQARACSARVFFNWGSEPVWIYADRVLLEQVVLNLTRNAVEAVAHVPIQQRFVYISLAQSSGEAVSAEQAIFTVEDSGQGVDPIVLQQLFTMYVTTKSEGMGIGLNICRSVAERFGGQLVHRPSKKGGASFEFSVPLAQSDQ